jgi:hypothetical protein
MSRTLSTPLTAEDLEYVKVRLPEEQIARLISLHGVEDGALEAKEEVEAEPQGEATGDSSEAGSGSEKDDEDLIGPTFDPSEYTEAEIKEYLEGNPGDKERVLALEADGKQRKGVLAL